jgi:DNA-binding LacI/PurR family transcriptional regulator
MTTRPRATAIGLVLRRSPRQLAAEPFYGELIGGLEEALAPHGLHVLMQVVDGMPTELANYRRWAATGAVRAVVLADLVADDPRPELLLELGLPGILLGAPAAPTGLPTVRTDDYAPMCDAVAKLAALGHTRIGRVTGPAGFVHTQERTRAFFDAAASLDVEGTLVAGDYSAESGAEATRELLRAGDLAAGGADAAGARPTAIIYDNDVMAIAGLAAVRSAGLAVPDDVSILAWDDSQLCLLASPPVSAMSHDVHERGVLAARSVLALLDGEDPGDVVSEAPVFVPRGTTAPAKALALSPDPA